MTRRKATRTTLFLLLMVGSYAIYRGVSSEGPTPPPRALRISAAASFFQPQSEDDPSDGAYQVKSEPLAAQIEEEPAEKARNAELRLLFKQTIAAFDFNQEGATPKTLARLKEICPDRTMLARLFKDELEAIGSRLPADRDRLIWLANSLQNTEMVAFWQDLLLRQTERFPNESQVRNPEHPTMDSRAVDVEQLQAIRNLGLIRNAPAIDTLVRVVLQPDKTAHRILHREQAFLALQTADPVASKKVLAQLPPDDELLGKLTQKSPL